MKQRKLVIHFLTIVMILLVILPIFNIYSLFINNMFDLKKLNKKDLFSLDIVESNINDYFYKNNKISLNEKQVIVGKNDFLFAGNLYSEVLDKTQGKYEYSMDDILDHPLFGIGLNDWTRPEWMNNSIDSFWCSWYMF